MLWVNPHKNSAYDETSCCLVYHNEEQVPVLPQVPQHGHLAMEVNQEQQDRLDKH